MADENCTEEVQLNQKTHLLCWDLQEWVNLYGKRPVSKMLQGGKVYFHFIILQKKEHGSTDRFVWIDLRGTFVHKSCQFIEVEEKCCCYNLLNEP